MELSDEELVDTVAEYIATSLETRFYFEKDNVELIWQSEMECYISLDFKTMTFKTSDSKDLWVLLDDLNSPSLIDFVKEYRLDETV